MLCALLITPQIVHRSSPRRSGDHLVSHQGVDPRLLERTSRCPAPVANALEGGLDALEGVQTSRSRPAAPRETPSQTLDILGFQASKPTTPFVSSYRSAPTMRLESGAGLGKYVRKSGHWLSVFASDILAQARQSQRVPARAGLVSVRNSRELWQRQVSRELIRPSFALRPSPPRTTNLSG